MRVQADISILGFGFAGALAGTIARRLGHRVVIVDRAAHPRFAIGESSTPAADLALRRMCDRYDIPRLRPLSAWGSWQRACPHIRGGIKRGFSYFMHEPGVPFTPNSRHSNELLAAASPDDERSDTQWYRADVDAYFAEEAARSGAVILESTEIDHLERADGWRLRGVRRGGERVSIQADFVIDATGGAGVLAQYLDLSGPPAAEMRTRSRAVFAHFTGVPRWKDYVAVRGAYTSDYPFDPDFSAQHHVLDGAWMWMLRFKDDTLSAGLVIDEKRHPLDVSLAPEAEFHRHLAAYPSLLDLFAGADVANPPGKFVRTGRLQRRTARAAGSDWALLPHAAGFVDPLHSTGIAQTLCGIERLTDILARHWNGPGFAPALASYSGSIAREIDFIDLLVSCCYRSMGNFRLWAASTMLYFAAATSYEHLQTESGDGARDRLFLLADDPELFGAAVEALRYLDRCGDPEIHAGSGAELDDGPDNDIDAAQYERLIEQAVRPFNHVGLFHPPAGNMYQNTVTPK